MKSQGGDVIFLISQPRAGSTMLQRILGGHPEIHTLAEPWCMLYPCFGLRGKGYAADYDAGGWARLAEENFYRHIGGRDVRVGAIRAMASTVYEKALSGTGKRAFLDKTPRYYYIISELAEVFPEARFILLIRNPLAVLCSIIRTWVEGHWERMAAYRDDLLVAPGQLAAGVKVLGQRAVTVHYETLVKRPVDEINRICRGLDIACDESILDYGKTMRQPLDFGDPQPVADDSAPEEKTADAWTADIVNPRIQRLAHDYLDFLGESLLSELGYDYDELMSTLRGRRSFRSLRAPSLKKVLSATS